MRAGRLCISAPAVSFLKHSAGLGSVSSGDGGGGGEVTSFRCPRSILPDRAVISNNISRNPIGFGGNPGRSQSSSQFVHKSGGCLGDRLLRTSSSAGLLRGLPTASSAFAQQHSLALFDSEASGRGTPGVTQTEQVETEQQCSGTGQRGETTQGASETTKVSAGSDSAEAGANNKPFYYEQGGKYSLQRRFETRAMTSDQVALDSRPQHRTPLPSTRNGTRMGPTAAPRRQRPETSSSLSSTRKAHPRTTTAAVSSSANGINGRVDRGRLTKNGAVGGRSPKRSMRALLPGEGARSYSSLLRGFDSMRERELEARAATAEAEVTGVG